MRTILLTILMASVARASVTDVERYQNTSTHMSMIQIKVKDIDTGKTLKLVVENRKLFQMFANLRGFTKEQYVNYMTGNDLIRIRLGDLYDQLSISSGQTGRSLHEIISKYHLVTQELSFKMMGVENEEQFLKKFFEYTDGCGSLRREYYSFAQWSDIGSLANLINFLIDRGFDVVWQDWSGALVISRYPTPSLD